MRRLIQPWQTRALSYYDMIGEIKFATNFIGHAMSLLDLFPAQIGEDGSVEQTDEPVVVQALARIQDPGGGVGMRSGLQEQYGKLMFLTGEVYMLVSNDPYSGLEQWEMLSVNELRVMDGVLMRYRAPSILVQNYTEVKDDDFFPLDDSDAVPYRLWKRSPLFSGLADSSMAGVLLICDELLKLTAVIRARVTSRLASSGILFLDEALSQTPLEAAGDEDPLTDILMQDLIEAAESAIANEGSASAIMPVIMRVPVPDGKKIQDMVYHLELVDPVQFYPETGLREECIRRIGIGLDLPAEIITGMGDMTHWNAWLTDEQVWKAHLQPMATQLVGDLTTSYLRPYLRNLGVENWQSYCIDFDASKIINRPDRSTAALNLYEQRIVGKQTVREANGFDEADAMTQEELNESLGVAVRDASLALYGIPILRQGGELEIGPGDLEVPSAPLPGAPAEETQAPIKGPGGASSETTKDKPPQPVPGEVLGSGEIDPNRFNVITELCVLRLRELAGAKIKNHAKKDPDVLVLIARVRAGMIAHTLGPDTVKRLTGQTEAQLVSGGQNLIEEAMEMLGVTDPATVELVVSNVERHAAKTLYDERPAPLPAPLVNRIAAAAKKNAGKQ